jgi:hypothetical protein
VVSFVLAFLAAARVFLRGRADTALEVLALLWVDNTPANMGSEVSTALTVLSLRHVKTVSSCLVLSRPSRCTPRFLPGTSRCRPGNPGPPPTGCRAQTQPTAATPQLLQPAVLDHSPRFWPLSSRMDEISLASLFFKSSLSAAHWVFEDLYKVGG